MKLSEMSREQLIAKRDRINKILETHKLTLTGDDVHDLVHFGKKPSIDSMTVASVEAFSIEFERMPYRAQVWHTLLEYNPYHIRPYPPTRAYTYAREYFMEV